MSDNPYAAPAAAVRDVLAQDFEPIRAWSPKGRIGRLRYLAYTTGPAFLAGILAGVLGPIAPPIGVILAVAIYAVAVVFSVIATIKRSHDMDWSGWTALLTLIPLVALIWVFKSGSPGSNRFGAPPPPDGIGVILLAIILPVLMFVGIVAAIAIPAYQDYVERAAGIP